VKYDLVVQGSLFDPDESSSHSAKLTINYRRDFLRRGGNYPRIAFEEMIQDRFITIYSTTSPQDSGLFGYLLPIFQAATRLKVEVAAVGTGEALALGRRGYADALFVHDRPAEDKFVADRYGVDRRDVMYDDFVIVGPSHDPAHIRGLKDIHEWLTSKAGLKAITSYKINGEQLFFPPRREPISKEGTALLSFDHAEGGRVFH
jgi:ABC-type tungstate transport system permease subunit